MTPCSCTDTVQNIVIDQGTDFDTPFTVLDTSGTPVNLTNAAAGMQIVPTYGAEPIVTLTSAAGGLLLGGALGTITPVLPASVTSTLPPGTYLYDIKLLLGSGITTRPFQGAATVCPEVTTLTLMPPPFVGGQFIFSIAGNSGLIAGVF